MTKLIAGLDEVGMGCIAGPLVVVVTAFEEHKSTLEGINDSKQLTPLRREKLVHPIMNHADYVGFGWADNSFIDKHGITASWQYAAAMATGTREFEELLVDGHRRVEKYSGRQNTYCKGDARFWQIGAASIVAKVFRDREMVYYHNNVPLWRWNQNAGYGTQAHYKLIEEHGVSSWHRRSFLGKKFWSKLRKTNFARVHPSLLALFKELNDVAA